MKITIPDCPPSLNKVLRMHWSSKRKLLNDWILLLRGACPRGAGLCNGRRNVKVTLHHSRLFDKDNSYGACKVIFDALKVDGFIVDDSRQWLEATVEQAQCPHKQRHTVIELEAL